MTGRLRREKTFLSAFKGIIITLLLTFSPSSKNLGRFLELLVNKYVDASRLLVKTHVREIVPTPLRCAAGILPRHTWTGGAFFRR